MENASPEASSAAGLRGFFWLIVTEMLLALLVGFVLLWLGTGGGAWILGGIIAGAIAFSVYRVRFAHQAQPNRYSRKVGQVLVGLTVGFSMQHSHLGELSPHLPVLVGLTLFLLVAGAAVGYLYSRLGKTDLLTAMLATVPGNIGVMAGITADYGGNVPLVSLVQLMRFTVVTLVIPLLVNVVTHTASSQDVSATIATLTQNLDSLNPPYLLWLMVVLVTTALAVKLGNKLKVPVATLLCAIAVGLSFNQLLNALPFLPAIDFSLPPLLNLLGQIFLGMTIGEYWGVNPRLSMATVFRATMPVVSMFFAGFISAGIALLLTDWDWLTCLLVTSPGGSPEMIWIALALNHNVEIVTTGHLVRLVAINLALPVLVSFAAHLEARSAVSHTSTTPKHEKAPPEGSASLKQSSVQN